MRQVLQNRSGLTVVREVPLPPCPPAGVLVRNEFSAISSGTERTSVESNQKSLLARARERPDLVRQTIDKARQEGLRATRDAVRRRLEEESPSGYSSAGIVLEVGPRVRGLEVGDRVACAGAGHANHAEVVAIPSNLCAVVPEGVSLQAASLTTLAAIALHSVRLAEVALAERVAVVGCGLIGQIVCRLLRSAGAEVFALDIDSSRIDDAVRGGADHGVPVGEGAAGAIRRLTDALGVDHAIVTAGAQVNAPLVLAAEITRDRGSVTLVGAVPIEFPRGPLYMKELRFRVSRSYGPGRYDPEYEERGLDYPIAFVRWTEQRNMEAVLSLQARGVLSLEDLIDEVIPVERGAGAAAPAIGLIGPGGFASQVLVPAFVAAGARLEVVGGGQGVSAEAATRTLGFARHADSAEAVIKDPAVDAVVIATRHGLHAQYVQAALAAGKHVFCEKPLALTVEELDAVMAAAADSERVLAVGFNRRFAPMAVSLRQALAPGSGPVVATYRVSAGAVPADAWVHDLEEGGGRVIGEVCHFIDTLVFLAGAPVSEVHASGCSKVGAPTQANDNVAVTLRHADGSLGTILYVAQSAPGIGKERIEAYGAGGVGVLDDYRELELYGPRAQRVKGRGQEKGHREEIAAFVAAVRSGQPPVPLTEVANVSLATIAVVESMRTGAAVRVEGP